MPSYFCLRVRAFKKLMIAKNSALYIDCHKIYCISTQLKEKSDVLRLSTPPTGLTLGAKEELLL